MFRTLSIALLLTACSGGSTDPDETGDTGLSEACALAAVSQTCPECSNGPMTCTFGETSATANSCGDCQARAELYNALCDAGETADQATIEADTVCEPAACEVVFDTCNDPCEPLCVHEGIAADIAAEPTCDLGCTAPVVEQRVCENIGTGCAWVEAR